MHSTCQCSFPVWKVEAKPFFFKQCLDLQQPNQLMDQDIYSTN